MTIETKYNIKDIVYILYYGKLIECTIDSFEIGVSHKKITKVKYNLKLADNSTIGGYLGKDLFSTKEEAAKVWLADQGLNIDIKDK